MPMLIFIPPGPAIDVRSEIPGEMEIVWKYSLNQFE